MRVVVAGGGLMGSALAYELAQRGIEAWVFDRHDAGRATSAGAGILSGETSGVSDTPYHELSRRAFAYYTDLVAALGADAIAYGLSGLALVALAGDEERFQKTREALRGRSAAVSDMDPEELRRRFPALGPVTGVLFDDRAARVDGRYLEARLRAAAIEQGARFEQREVLALDAGDNSIGGVYTSAGAVQADAVVVAAGAWSTRLLDAVALTVPVVPHRGQIVHVDHPPAQGPVWPILEGFRGHYVLPWPDGHIVAGATREAGSGYAPWLTAEGQAEVLAELFRVAPGVRPAVIREWRVGLRPASIDGRPLMGAMGDVPGLYVLTGHGPGGLLLGPYSASLVADEIAGRAIPTDFSAFRPDRSFDPDPSKSAT